jgi:hypothetical protein
MFAIVMAAPLAAAGPLVCSAVAVALAVVVAVPDAWVVLLDPPHAVATAATRHMAAQNKPNLFIVTPLDLIPWRDTLSDPDWFKRRPNSPSISLSVWPPQK